MKFSWSPRGLLSAALNDARFKLDGKVRLLLSGTLVVVELSFPADQTREIAGKDLLASHFAAVPLYKGFALEGLANRDSFPYAETYRLGPIDSLRDLFRGTLR